jgi:hypothetical protein
LLNCSDRFRKLLRDAREIFGVSKLKDRATYSMV